MSTSDDDGVSTVDQYEARLAECEEALRAAREQLAVAVSVGPAVESRRVVSSLFAREGRGLDRWRVGGAYRQSIAIINS